MDTSRKYEFSWDLLGDLQLGRPKAGTQLYEHLIGPLTA